MKLFLRPVYYFIKVCKREFRVKKDIPVLEETNICMTAKWSEQYFIFNEIILDLRLNDVNERSFSNNYFSLLSSFIPYF